MRSNEEGGAPGGTRPERRHDLRAATDEALLLLVRGGSSAAFGELYRRHAHDVLSYARRLTRRHLDRDAADDVVAEAVRKVLTALEHGRGPVIGFRQYLFTAVRSVIVTEWGARRHEDLVEDVPDREVPAADECLDGVVAMAAFDALPERWRDVLWTTRVSELTPTETAPLMGLRPSAVAALALRAREALRVGYVRAHLPRPLARPCRDVLDLLARRVVASIGPHQQRLLSEHLATCDACRRGAANIEEEVGTWARTVGWDAVVEVFGAAGTPAITESQDVA